MVLRGHFVVILSIAFMRFKIFSTSARRWRILLGLFGEIFKIPFPALLPSFPLFQFSKKEEKYTQIRDNVFWVYKNKFEDKKC